MITIVTTVRSVPMPICHPSVRRKVHRLPVTLRLMTLMQPQVAAQWQRRSVPCTTQPRECACPSVALPRCGMQGQCRLGGGAGPAPRQERQLVLPLVRSLQMLRQSLRLHPTPRRMRQLAMELLPLSLPARSPLLTLRLRLPQLQMMKHGRPRLTPAQAFPTPLDRLPMRKARTLPRAPPCTLQWWRWSP